MTAKTPEGRAWVEKKLSEAFAEEWDPRRPSTVEVVEEGQRIGLRFRVSGSKGVWKDIHDEPPVEIATARDAEDLVARGLSIFLMKHPVWPR